MAVGTASAANGGNSAAVTLTPRPPRLPATAWARSATTPKTVRVAALRAEFIPDTLATTTGDGRFAYSQKGPLYDELQDSLIYFDPPPHDADYFSDHLSFLKFYFNLMSDGLVALEWDIFPTGERTAYQLPRQMWQYNWNSTSEQLDRGLTELFRDAVTAADTAPGAPEWSRYDLVVIFHAGAGAEFDLGYTLTPHDIPSAWMVPEDFIRFGLERGVPVRGGGYVNEGLILPETETHGGVQISIAGVMCSLFGHYLGLPVLYDRDDGNPVVGKWSLMDRAFGNFYGALPGPVDAWSRAYMGWLEPVDIAPGIYSVAAFGVAAGDTAQALRISITDSEYFLIENRNRDPEGDSVAVARDRDGRRMVFNEDYTVTIEPGFRVPVEVDNLDFDSPGSGILIWHIDERMLPLIPQGRFNSLDDRPGLDLEEADGAQDIGRNYPFLTPGYGTDYGIYTDAWYFGNPHHLDANGGRPVSFGNSTYPPSWANSGALTHINLDQFSTIAPVMSFRFRRESLMWRITTPPLRSSSQALLVSGEFYTDTPGEELLQIADSVRIIGLDGSVAAVLPIPEPLLFSRREPPVVRDLNGDGRDDVVWAGRSPFGHFYRLLGMISGFDESYEVRLVDSLSFRNQGAQLFIAASGQPELTSRLTVVRGDSAGSELRTYSDALIKTAQIGITGKVAAVHRVGAAGSDSVLVVQEDGELFLWTHNNLERLDDIPVNGPVGATALANFNGANGQDLWLMNAEGNQAFIKTDFSSEAISPITNVSPPQFRTPPSFALPANVDDDGAFEILVIAADGAINALYPNGLIVGGFPLRRPEPAAGTERLHSEGLILADLYGDGSLSLLFTEYAAVLNDDGEVLGSYQLRGYSIKGRDVFGLPLELEPDGAEVRLVNGRDSTGAMRKFIAIADRYGVALHQMNFSGAGGVWWSGLRRDDDGSAAVWETANGGAPPPDGGLLVLDECYGWPNPARGELFFRYRVTQSASVTIDIFDITGERFTTLRGSGAPPLPQEIRWDLSDVPRGAYIAVLEAKGGGQSERKRIKVAVVR